MRKLFLIALPFLALIAAALGLRTPDTDRAAMEATYTDAASRFAESPTGLRVHYRDQGNPDGIPIVLLHGMAGSLHIYEDLIDYLGDEYRLISLTFPGHGLTGPHPEDDYSIDGMLEALDLVTETLSLDRFVLAGHSMGGRHAWRYALDNQDKLSALVLIAPSGAPTSDTEPTKSNIGFRLAQTSAGRFLLQHYTPRSIIAKSTYQSVSEDYESLVTDDFIDRHWRMLRYPGNRRAAALIMSDRNFSVEFDRVGEITESTLIIWGAKDDILSVSGAQAFGDAMANADVVIYEDVGHLPLFEQAERTALDIDAFLERTVKRAGN
ncbi:MAG: alpha/beta hydrolase [Pseudomonadota bacterium]